MVTPFTPCRLSMIPPKSSYERLIAGGVAGAVSRSVVAPFERLRTIMMTSSLSLAEACQNVLSEQGILGALLSSLPRRLQIFLDTL